MKYEIAFGRHNEEKKGRVLFQKDPIFTCIESEKQKEQRLSEKEKWRFPAVNIHSRNTITCHVCSVVLVEVIKEDEKGEEIRDFRNYPVYINVGSEGYYGSHYKNSGVCVSCWKTEKHTLKKEEEEKAMKRKARSEKQKAKREAGKNEEKKI